MSIEFTKNVNDILEKIKKDNALFEELEPMIRDLTVSHDQKVSELTKNNEMLLRNITTLEEEKEYLFKSLQETDYEFSQFEIEMESQLDTKDRLLDTYKAELHESRKKNVPPLPKDSDLEQLNNENEKLVQELKKAHSHIEKLECRLKSVKELKSISNTTHANEKKELASRIELLEAQLKIATNDDLQVKNYIVERKELLEKIQSLETKLREVGLVDPVVDQNQPNVNEKDSDKLEAVQTITKDILDSNLDLNNSKLNENSEEYVTNDIEKDSDKLKTVHTITKDILDGQFSNLDFHNSKVNENSEEYVTEIREKIADYVSGWKKKFGTQEEEIVYLKARIEEMETETAEKSQQCENCVQLEAFNEQEDSKLVELKPVFDSIRLELQETIDRIQTWEPKEWEYRDTQLERIVQTDPMYLELQDELFDKIAIIEARDKEIRALKESKKELMSKFNNVSRLNQSHEQLNVQHTRSRTVSAKKAYKNLITVSSSLVPTLDERVSLRVQILDLKQMVRERDMELDILRKEKSQSNSHVRQFIRERSVKDLSSTTVLDAANRKVTSHTTSPLKTHEKVTLAFRVQELEKELFDVYKQLDDANDTVLQWIEFSNETEIQMKKYQHEISNLKLQTGVIKHPAIPSENLFDINPPFVYQDNNKDASQKTIQEQQKLIQNLQSFLKAARIENERLEGMISELDEQYQKEWDEELKYREELIAEIEELQQKLDDNPRSSVVNRRRSSIPVPIPVGKTEGEARRKSASRLSITRKPSVVSKAEVVEPPAEISQARQTISKDCIAPRSSSNRRTSLTPTNPRASIKITDGRSTNSRRRSSVVVHVKEADTHEPGLSKINHSLNQLSNSVSQIRDVANIQKLEHDLLEKSHKLDEANLIILEMERESESLAKRSNSLTYNLQLKENEVGVLKHRLNQLEELENRLEMQQNERDQLLDELNRLQMDLNMKEDLVIRQKDHLNSATKRIEALEKEIQQIQISRRGDGKEVKTIGMFSVKDLESTILALYHKGSISYQEYQTKLLTLNDLRIKQDRLLLVQMKFQEQLQSTAKQLHHQIDPSSIHGIEQAFGIPTTEKIEDVQSPIAELKARLAKQLQVNQELEKELELLKSQDRYYPMLETNQRLSETQRGEINLIALNRENEQEYILTERIKILEHELSILSQTVQNGQSETQNQRGKIDDLEEKKKALENENENLKMICKAFEEKDTLKNDQANTMTERIKLLENELSMLSQTIQNGKSEIESQRAKIDDLEQKKKALEDENVKAHDMLAQYQLDLHKNREMAREALDINRKLESKLTEQHSVVNVYEQEVKSLRESNLAISEQLNAQKQKKQQEIDVQTELCASKLSNLEVALGDVQRQLIEKEQILSESRLALEQKQVQFSEMELTQKKSLEEQQSLQSRVLSLQQNLTESQHSLRQNEQQWMSKETLFSAKLKDFQKKSSKYHKEIQSLKEEKQKYEQKMKTCLQVAQHLLLKMDGSVVDQDVLLVLQRLEEKYLEIIKNYERNELELRTEKESLKEAEKKYEEKLKLMDDGKLKPGTSEDSSLLKTQIDELKHLLKKYKKNQTTLDNTEVNQKMTTILQDLISGQKEAMKALIEKSKRELQQYSIPTSVDDNSKLKHKYSEMKIHMHNIVVTMEDLFQQTLSKSVFAKSKLEELQRYIILTRIDKYSKELIQKYNHMASTHIIDSK